MLDPASQIVAAPHPPEAYRAIVRGSQVSRAAALTIAHKGDLARTRARNDAVLTLAQDSEGFFFPVCSVHPADGLSALREIDRVVFGSDYPVDHPLDAIRAVVELGFTDAEQAAILHDNAAALLTTKPLNDDR